MSDISQQEIFMASSPNSKLVEAAETGDVRRLHKLIENDSKLLDNNDPFADTALHIAARHGKTIFAVEIAIVKPCFRKKLNPIGFTPLHEALKAKNWETAAALATLDGELIRVKGSRGKTPLHVAAEVAPPKLLAEFLYICPESLEDVTSRWETVVHCALKKQNFENFMVLISWMITTRKEYLLEWKDFKGNTTLHLAAAKRLKEVLKIVVRYVPRKTKNFKDQTALQVCLELRNPEHQHPDDQECIVILTKFNVFNLFHELHNYFKGHFQKTTILKKLNNDFLLVEWLRAMGFPQVNTEDSEKSRDVVLLVATLIATATYQAILAPPGGYWEDYSSSQSPPPHHSAGQLIMKGLNLVSFTATNAVAFCFAVAAIVLNVVQLKQAVLLTVATYVLLFNYMYTIFLAILIGRDEKWTLENIMKTLFHPKHKLFYPQCIPPMILLAISLVYAVIGTYVALRNKYVNDMETCKRRSIPVLDGHQDDVNDDDDEEEEEEEEEKTRWSCIP